MGGNIEVHLNSSDWYRHNHDKDYVYRNVILHVVYINDSVVYREFENEMTKHNSEKKKTNIKEAIPTLALKGKFNNKLYDNYKGFIENKSWVACEKLIANTDTLVLKKWDGDNVG